MAIGTKLGRLALRSFVRAQDIKPALALRDIPVLNYTEAGGMPLPRNFRAGGIIANGTDADHDINIAVGQFRDSTDAKNILLETAMGKRLDATWAEGGTTGAPVGGLASGVSMVADTTYHVFLVKDTGAITAIVDNSGDITVSAASHLMTTASRVTISGTKNYDGDYAVTAVSAGVSFDVTATFVPDHEAATGTYETVDAGFDTSTTASNLLSDSGFSHFRRVGSFTTDEQATTATDILGFFQIGNQFWYTNPGAELLFIDEKGLASTSGRVTVTPDHIPVGFKVIARCNFYADDPQAWGLYVSSLDINEESPSETVAPLQTMAGRISSKTGGMLDIPTNTSGQFGIESRETNINDSLGIATLGWYDFLGDDD
jgi:hypothetical protein